MAGTAGTAGTSGTSGTSSGVTFTDPGGSQNNSFNLVLARLAP